MAAPTPRQSAGPAPTRGDAHRRHPSWGPISGKSQNLVHESEFWSLDAATSRVHCKVTLHLAGVAAAPLDKNCDSWTTI